MERAKKGGKPKRTKKQSIDFLRFTAPPKNESILTPALFQLLFFLPQAPPSSPHFYPFLKELGKKRRGIKCFAFRRGKKQDKASNSLSEKRENLKKRKLEVTKEKLERENVLLFRGKQKEKSG